MDRYAAAIVASAIYNVNRSSADSPLIEPIDFVRVSDPQREQTTEIKRVLKSVIGQMPTGTSRDKYLEVKERVIASLTAQGRKDARELFDEAWPSLK
jgi:hypothetical protein